MPVFVTYKSNYNLELIIGPLHININKIDLIPIVITVITLNKYN